MVVSAHTSQLATPDRPAAERSGQRPSDGAPNPDTDGPASAQVRHLLDRASGLNLRAPELARVLGERAAVLAESAGGNTLWIHAEALAVLTAVRLGYRAETAGRAVTVLRAAEDAGEHVLAVRLRTALAVCARGVGAPLTGSVVLRHAVSAPGVPGAHRAAALCQLARCVAGVAGKAELDKTFATADRLCSEDGTLAADTKLVRRALVRVGMSVHRRRYGDVVGAADAARTGLGFLDGLEDAASDGGVARARLSLELATASLDRGEAGVALETARPIFARPLRAAETAPVTWLRLAIATRVHLAAGEGYAATRLLRDALRETDRHAMRALSAQLRSELAHVEERMGRPGDALEILRDARADERADARARGHAYAVLTSEFGVGTQPELDLGEILAEQPLGTAAAHVAEPAAAPLTLERSTDEVGSAVDEPTHQAAEPGAVARSEDTPAGSVLDRLGIAGGHSERGGGRRRATDTVASEPAASEPAARDTAPAGTATGESEPASTAVPRQAEAEGAEGAASAAGSGESAAEDMDWLPKLRLPPSLAPVEELYTSEGRTEYGGAASGGQHSTARSAETERPGSADAERADPAGGALEPTSAAEPAADAGLAELLTRALAEHQSGGSSAATLVARLGSGDEPSDEAPRRNGRHRTEGE